MCAARNYFLPGLRVVQNDTTYMSDLPDEGHLTK